MKMKNQNKLVKMEENARKKAIEDHERFWAQFSKEELQRIVDSDPDQIKKLNQLGEQRIERAFQLALTEEELKEYFEILDLASKGNYEKLDKALLNCKFYF